MGVIYRARDDVAELLIPFARAHGSVASDEAIYDEYRLCSLGAFDTSELWRRLGVLGSAADLDKEYLGAHETNVGLDELVVELSARGVQVACISNDVSSWSRWLRAHHQLEQRISPWVVSGDVGIRKPDLGIFRRFEQLAGLSPAQCVFVDDQPKNVEAARQLGYRTIIFAPPGASAGHDAVSDLRAIPARVDGITWDP